MAFPIFDLPFSCKHLLCSGYICLQTRSYKSWQIFPVLCRHFGRYLWMVSLFQIFFCRPFSRFSFPDFLPGVWLQKGGTVFSGGWKQNKKPKNRLSLLPLCSLLTLSVPIPLNLPSSDAFVIPTTILRTLDPFKSNVYMRERNRIKLHSPRLEPGTSDIPQ